MIRPQSMQQKNHQKLLENLKIGDKVITRGGIVGKIVDIIGKNKDKLIIESSNGTKMTIVRSYIISIDE